MNDIPKILVVDDAPVVLDLLVSTLTCKGYQVYPADSGKLALAALAVNLPDLILLDIRMEGMDGIEVCRRLKAREATRRIPIILISGDAEVSDWVEGLQLGISDYLIKPFTPQELLKRVKILLALSQANASIEHHAALLRQTNEQLQAEIVKRQGIEDELRRSLDRAERARLAMLSTLEDQKRTETALRESEERFQQLFDNMSDGVAVYRATEQGRDFVFVDINKRGQTLSHIHRDEAIGRRVTELFPAVERLGLLDVFRRVWQTGRPEHHPVTHYKDGRIEQWVENYVYKLPSGLVVAVYADITDKRKAEEEKEKLNRQLCQAQKMESIGILAGGIAHDFNNILGVIMGYTDMARENVPVRSQLAQDLDKVLSASHRAAQLVKQILAFSRQSVADRIPIQIQALAKESLKMLRSSIPSIITFKENIHPSCGVILADPTQVHQVIMNLCTNAYHAMEMTGGVLSVGMRAISIDSPSPLDGRPIIPGEYIELTVSDTGTGIDPDIIGKIFDPYFTTKEIGKGTGMGLSITHGIIKDYGGAITVESILGQGTTFHVYFPVIHQEVKEFAESQEAPGGKGRILFVDDEEFLAEAGKRTLEMLGYAVTAHTRATEALTDFMKDPDQFDLVITDQTMPGMTGADLATEMLRVRPELPIILCTGFSHLANKESAKAIGIREFAVKPVSRSTIAQLARKLLGREVKP